MNYKVGDTAIMQKNSVGHFIVKGESVKVLKAECGELENIYLVQANDGIRTIWVGQSFIEPSEPDYRALYGQEKERRIQLVAMINSITPNMAEQYMRHDYRSMWELWGKLTKWNEEQLKQQYNGQDSATAL